jgi:LAGLIDADG endonuclease
MIYAMISIGILGFIVWSLLVAPLEEFLFFLTISWISLYFYRNIELLTTFYCSNVNNRGISAGNYNKNRNLINDATIESSEILRKSPFALFRLNYSLLYNKNFDEDDQWLFWFIGFVEGDGAILSYNKRASFIITQKEEKILNEIQKVLGFGQVKNFKGFSRYMVHDNKNIFLLFCLFNRHLVLSHRQAQLEKWYLCLINAVKFNWSQFKIVEMPTFNFEKKNWNGLDSLVTPSLENAWLSGFTDAEGCFYVYIVESKTINFRYILDQKEENILQNIKELFGVGSIRERKSTINPVYRLEISCNKLETMNKICEYFRVFPLRTTKNKNFSYWLDIFQLVQKGKHKTLQGLIEIKQLKSLMNKYIIENQPRGLAKFSLKK